MLCRCGGFEEWNSCVGVRRIETALMVGTGSAPAGPPASNFQRQYAARSWAGSMMGNVHPRTGDELQQAAIDGGRLPGRVDAVSYMEFLTTEYPPRKPLLEPWLTEKAIVMVHGWRGVGKSFFVHSTAWAVAAGSGFLEWKAPESRRVLLIDGEMPADALQDRLRRVVNNSQVQPPLPDSLMIAAADITENGLLRVGLSEVIERCDEFVARHRASSSLMPSTRSADRTVHRMPEALRGRKAVVDARVEVPTSRA